MTSTQVLAVVLQAGALALLGWPARLPARYSGRSTTLLLAGAISLSTSALLLLPESPEVYLLLGASAPVCTGMFVRLVFARR